ncbi:uncharacterized protein LOC116253928 isoform X2 [Nymphaea colorata]|uniref:uncharacterized protein LOC116253928 isoform X2 n=1 Tax=Nymphaea colorata TaxID=210225 RepID=UPI00214E71CF|nr:uncharacterized protein LOC116253928 isoform X2 [Nymphaea colorata]
MMLGHEKYTSSSTSKAKRKRGISWAEKSNRLAQQVGRAREAERGAIGELCQPRLSTLTSGLNSACLFIFKGTRITIMIVGGIQVVPNGPHSHLPTGKFGTLWTLQP